MAGIVLSIEVDDKGTVKVKQFTDETKKAFEEMKRGPQSVKASLDSLKDSWITLTAKVTAATAAFYGINKTISSFVDEAAKAEEIENRLRYALETTGYTWQYAKIAVDEFATTIQKTTRFSDEQARQALTDMMMYTQDFTKAQEGARLAMDMSVRTGHDLSSATRLIGMAMSGNVEMLGRYIPELRNLEARLGDNVTMAQKAEYAMKVLKEKFGGTAQADLNSYSGQLAQVRNAWSELKETLGMHFLPVLKEVFVWFKKVIDIANEWAGKGKEKDVLGQLRSDLKEAERTIEIYEEFLRQAQTARPGTPYRLGPEATQEARERLQMWKDWAKYLREQIETEEKTVKSRLEAERKIDILPEISKEDVTSYARLMYEAWKEEYYSYYDEIYDAQKKAHEERQFWMEEEARWKKIQMDEEYEAIREGIERARDLYQFWLDERFRQIEEEEEAIREGLENSRLLYQEWIEEYTKVNEYQKIWETVSENISSAWSNTMTNIIKGTKKTSDVVKNFFGGIADAFVSSVSKMIANWILFGNIMGKYKTGSGLLGIVGGILGFEKGGIIAGWKPIAQFQEGGIVRRPTLGLIGEKEPEAVVPLKNGKIPIESPTPKQTANIFYIYALDPISFRDFVRRNPAPILEIINEDARAAGPMRTIIKSMG